MDSSSGTNFASMGLFTTANISSEVAFALVVVVVVVVVEIALTKLGYLDRHSIWIDILPLRWLAAFLMLSPSRYLTCGLLVPKRFIDALTAVLGPHSAGGHECYSLEPVDTNI